MKRRSAWLVLALLVCGCFSESPSTDGCVEGEAACDCRPDGTCVADHECIASIDKCVPRDCTPGGESCTCVDGACLTSFVCDGGVCVPPSVATTGGDPTVASSLSDTVADTGPDPTMATTEPTGASATTMTTDDPTIPPDDTSATDVSVSMSGEVSTDPSQNDATASESESDTSPAECPACIVDAGADVCEEHYGPCSTDIAAGGCADLMSCMQGQMVPPAECCKAAVNDGAKSLWNLLVGCAQDSTCDGTCDRLCIGG